MPGSGIKTNLDPTDTSTCNISVTTENNDEDDLLWDNTQEFQFQEEKGPTIHAKLQKY